MTHDRTACEFCQAVDMMNKITAMLEGAPKFDVPLYDDAVNAVLAAIDDALSELYCWAADIEGMKLDLGAEP